MAALEDAVDAFVAPRPWWSIDPAGSASSRQVILTRWPFLELRLRLLVLHELTYYATHPLILATYNRSIDRNCHTGFGAVPPGERML